MVRLIASYEESLEDVRLTQSSIPSAPTVFSFGDQGFQYGPLRRPQTSTLDETYEPAAKRPRHSYDCDLCGTSYTEKRSLARHNRTPAHCEKAGMAIPQYCCSWASCGQLFARNDVRIRHENEQHLGVKPPGRYNPLVQSAAHLRQALASNNSLSPIVQSDYDLNDSQTQSPKAPEFPWIPAEDMELDHVVSSETASSFTKDDYDTSNQSTQSDTSLSAVSIDTPPSSDVPDENADKDSIRSVQTCHSFERKFELPIRTRSAFLRAGASVRPNKIKPPPLCPLCKDPWPKVFPELRNHLQSHINDLKGEHLCKDCDVGFVHRPDLDRHLQSAATHGHCGFPFEHQFECTGHHPRDEFDDILSDHERVMLCTQLRHWEQSQLRAFMDHLDGIVQVEDDGDYWSIGALRSCTTSVTSLGTLVAGYSAPDEAGYQTSFRRNLSLNPRRWRMAGQAKASQTTLSKTLADQVALLQTQRNKIDLVVAAHNGNFSSVKELLAAGADSNTSFDTSRMPSGAYTDPAWRITWRDISKDIGRLTPLYAAARAGHMHIVALLLQNGALVAPECAARSAILYALSGRTPNFARWLRFALYPMEENRSGLAEYPLLHVSDFDPIHEWVTVLERAVEIGCQRDLDICLNSVKRLSNADACFTYGLTIAVKHGKTAILNLMLQHGTISLSGHCWEELCYTAGGCPLCIAKEHGRGNIVASLIRSRQVVGCNSQSWRCPRWEAVTMTERDVWSAEDWENCRDA